MFSLAIFIELSKQNGNLSKNFKVFVIDKVKYISKFYNTIRLKTPTHWSLDVHDEQDQISYPHETKYSGSMYSDIFGLKTRINRISSLKGCLEYSIYSKSPLTIYTFNDLVCFQIIFLLPENLSNLMGQPCTLHSSQFLQNYHGHSFTISRKHPSTFH